MEMGCPTSCPAFLDFLGRVGDVHGKAAVAGRVRQMAYRPGAVEHIGGSALLGLVTL